ncbi:Succinate-semialdehyde dehydrogenase [NADP(+)] GabD [Colletotrichum orbiculare MAFF 240422]|uniref:Succinate-semialdehyde dehydrogenase [NADP(+)] GabD n=1 Tax=Colletotrichum orbiculare (strain 104-T / ATCC 96160 / CBS 514.97 / LARS 414 / MAFF 240422) TaxID=1213857 RepID=A0A484FDB4_COLOR|nr:Succinate-semialdehyde dehydrogenase [NADP(+)] GabD [Colletotrichum orbiculare MAFF 240422]
MAIKPQLHDPSLLIGHNLIDGKWQGSVSGKTFDILDPATGDQIGTCPSLWLKMPRRDRAHILRRWFELVMENKNDLTTLIIWENGKAKADAAGEVTFAASFLEWFAEEAARVYGDVIPHSNASMRVSVLKEPIGVCGLITPWNFPAAMATRELGPALAAGCTVVLKTAGETPFTANAVVHLGERAGIPKGVINVVTALRNTAEIGAAICTSDTVRKISFTGSTRVGKLLMQQSSRSLKRLSLELGGNAPFLVFDDCDLDLAVAGVVASKFKSSGRRALKEAVGRFKLGKGFDDGVTHGPLISPDAVRRVSDLADEAVRGGAKVEVGGKAREDLGPNFFEPTVISNIRPGMKIITDEIFGPVAPVMVFDSEEEVVDAANRCEVGLASYVFTDSLDRATRVSELLQFGMVALNTGVISDAAAPFGGIKHSGMGREGSKYGIEDYLTTKTVVIGNTNVIHRSHL